MSIIGVTHCPFCKAVVNASWQTCLACSSILEHLKPEATFSGPQETSTKYTKPCGQVSEDPNQGNFVDIVDQNQGSEELKTLDSFKLGTTIQYRIPTRIQSPTNHEWKWHRGTIGLVDGDRQMVLIIPETEQEPWRWVAMVYIK